MCIGMLQQKKSLLLRVHGAVKIVEPWGILLAVIAIFPTVGQFWLEFGDRVEERQVRAWQLVTTIAPGNSGKIEALEYLNSEDGLFCFESLKGKLDWLHDDKDIKCLILLKSRVPLFGINLSHSANDVVDDSSPQMPRSFPYMSNVFLANVDLREAVLTGANLRGAVLNDANLSEAELSKANLFRANLFGADLSGANLVGADLSEANLFGANLSEANLSGANLSGATLFGADLYSADLEKADLSGANLVGADLSGALNLRSDQFDQNTCGDSSTKLPKGLTTKDCE